MPDGGQCLANLLVSTRNMHDARMRHPERQNQPWLHTKEHARTAFACPNVPPNTWYRTNGLFLNNFVVYFEQYETLLLTKLLTTPNFQLFRTVFCPFSFHFLKFCPFYAHLALQSLYLLPCNIQLLFSLFVPHLPKHLLNSNLAGRCCAYVKSVLMMVSVGCVNTEAFESPASFTSFTPFHQKEFHKTRNCCLSIVVLPSFFVKPCTSR